jgi:hypothetical protein
VLGIAGGYIPLASQQMGKCVGGKGSVMTGWGRIGGEVKIGGESK